MSMIVQGHRPVKTGKRFKFFQITPDPGVAECGAVHGPRYWEITIHDGIDHRDARSGPAGAMFIAIPPKGRAKAPTPHEVACRAAGELNEARGFIMTRYIYNGLPVLGVLWASNGTYVFPIRSSAPERVKPIPVEVRRALECGGVVPAWAIKVLRGCVP